MLVTISIFLYIWFILGLLRYLFDSDVKTDVTIYKPYTIFIHGPWWWFIWIVGWSWLWLPDIFKLKEKDE